MVMALAREGNELLKKWPPCQKQLGNSLWLNLERCQPMMLKKALAKTTDPFKELVSFSHNLLIFAEANGITFQLLSDWPDFKTIETFGVGREGTTIASRATFVFDAEGNLTTVIDDQRDMNAHPSGALEAVKALNG